MIQPGLDAFLAGLLEPVTGAVAQTTPGLAALGGVQGLRRAIAEQLEHLSVAVALDAPRVFAAHVAWERALSREAERSALLDRCLEVLEDHLASGSQEPDRTVLREALRLARDTVAAVRAGPPPRPRAELEVAAYLQEAQEGHRRVALARVDRWRVDEGPIPALLRLARAQNEVGDRWFAGEVPVVVEHRVTAISEAAIARLAPPPGAGGRAVFACAPGDFHSIGPAIAAALLGHRGWEVELLGADTPARELARLVRETRPDLVGLGVGPLAVLAGAREAARSAREACPGAMVVAGGWAARFAGARLLEVDRVEPAAYEGVAPPETTSLGCEATETYPES